MNSIGGAVALFCAIALWGQSTEAQSPPSRHGCLAVMTASGRAYMTHAQEMMKKRQSVGLTQAEVDEMTTVLRGMDRVVAASDCSLGVWNDLKQCTANAMKSADITSEEGYRMIATSCYRRISDVYGQ